MPNQYKNKVVYGDEVLIDITDTTATQSDVARGKYFYLASGEKVEGTASGQMVVIETEDSHGGTVVEITGDAVKLQQKNVTPSTSQQTVAPDSGYNGLSQVVVSAIPGEYIIPTGTKSITENGTGIDVRQYATVDVAVPPTVPTLQEKSVTPTEQSQEVVADSGYDGLLSVTVGAISSDYVGSGVARKGSADLTVSGATITAPAGYYENPASVSVPSGTAGTPTATKGIVSNHAVTVTPSVTNTAGYISGGTIQGTGVSVSASELASGTLSITENGTHDVVGKASVNVDVSDIPSNRAILVARIPSGSTVTATKGGVSVTPMMWVSETYPDQDIALFVFAPAQFDSTTPWTITATDGTSTASTTVLITTNKEYEVELVYKIVFVSNGVLTSLPWTIATNPSYPGAAVVQETGQVMFTTGSEYAATVFGSTDAYDLTDYTTLRLVVASGQSYYRSDKAPCVAIGRDRPTGTGTSASATNLDYRTMLNRYTGTIAANTYTLDVSALSGLFYVGISLAGSANLSGDYAGKIRVTDFGIFK